MKAIFSLIVSLFFIAQPLFSQADTTAKAPSKWKLSWVGSLNGSQAEYSNWSQGGNSAVAATASTVFDGTYKNEHFGYLVRLNLKFGQSRIEWKDVQKTDDLIRLTNKVDYYFNDNRFSAFSEVDFRTQFDQGFNNNQVLISNFFAPAFFQETAGMSFKPNSLVTTQVGLSLKQTFVLDDSVLVNNQYGLTPGKNYRGEGGLSFALGVKTPVYENMSYTGSIETFTNFLTSLDRTDFTFSNEVSGKINSKLSTNIQFVLMYDRDFNSKIQIKQVIALGLNFVFI